MSDLSSNQEMFYKIEQRSCFSSISGNQPALIFCGQDNSRLVRNPTKNGSLTGSSVLGNEKQDDTTLH